MHVCNLYQYLKDAAHFLWLNLKYCNKQHDRQAQLQLKLQQNTHGASCFKAIFILHQQLSGPSSWLFLVSLTVQVGVLVAALCTQ